LPKHRETVLRKKKKPPKKEKKKDREGQRAFVEEGKEDTVPKKGGPLRNIC